MAEVEQHSAALSDAERWVDVNRLFLRGGPLAGKDFEPNEEYLAMLRDEFKILVIGAGGLGCELLKDLALMGFRDISVIDMDTIDLSNLNRQFLFRRSDVGKSKAEVAAAFINQRVLGANVTPYFKKIEDFGPEFYRGFTIIVCGLDSVPARRWINSMVHSLLEYDSDGHVVRESVVPLVDGGTEGFKGNARVVYPGRSSCVECTLHLYPPATTFPMCTISSRPRLPEHCVEYAKLIAWPKEHPDVPLDGDDPEHIHWVVEHANEHGAKFNVPPVTYRLAQGVVKNIIPAVASTNALIAAATAMEVFKVATATAPALDNYMFFNDGDGLVTQVQPMARNESCPVCFPVPRKVAISPLKTLGELIEYLKDSAEWQLSGPTLLTQRADGSHHTLYASNGPLHTLTEGNHYKTLADLGLVDGQTIGVADNTSATGFPLVLNFA